MSTRYRVSHRTVYQYGEMMSRGHTVTHLIPRSGSRQVLIHAEVTIDPIPDERFEFMDAFGNRVVQFVVATPHDRLVVAATSEVELVPPFAPVNVIPWDGVVWWPPSVSGFMAPSTFASPTPEVEEFARESFVPGRPIVDVGRDLCRRIHEAFSFDPSFTEVATPLAHVLSARRGVCQDFAHLAVACLRGFGLPARYISGYVDTVPPPGMAKVVGADASHAWCAVGLPDGTWFDFDPTNDQAPPAAHVVAAYGRDYLDVAPVVGVVVGPATTQTLEVEVDVSAI